MDRYTPAAYFGFYLHTLRLAMSSVAARLLGLPANKVHAPLD